MLNNICTFILIIGLMESLERGSGEIIQVSKPDEWTNFVMKGDVIYAVGRNVLISFDKNLKPLKEVSTSQNDSNKILLINGDQLIMCGTNETTACLIRNLSNFDILLKSESKYRVVTNSATKTTVAVIGQKNKNIMFVGNSLDKRYIEDKMFSLYPIAYNGIFAVSLNTFDFYSCKQTTLPDLICSSMPIKFANYYVNYVASFILEGYVYFFKYQEWRQDSKSLQSSVARVCEDDINYFNSYFEMPIMCNNLTNITAATFIRADKKLSMKLNIALNEYVFVVVFPDLNQSKSVLCLISSSKISKIFTENKKLCSSTDMFYIPNINCSNYVNNNITNDFCGGVKDSQRTSMIGINTISLDSFIELDIKVTSLLGYSNETASVLLVGAENGSVSKMDLNSMKTKTTNTKGNSAAKNIILSEDSQFIYWRTSDLIYRTELASCESNTCGGCLYPSNPLCGWCTLENKCTRAYECPNNAMDGRWIESDTKDCPSFSLDGDLEVTTNKTLTIGIKNFPTTGDTLECLFNENVISTARIDSTGITCDVPNNLLYQNADSYNATLFLRLSGRDVNLFEKNISVYKCNSLKNCSDCVVKSMCYFNSSSYTCGTLPSSKTCPRIKSNFTRIHTGNVKSLKFELGDVENLKLDNLRCQLLSQNVTLPVNITNNNYFCSPYTFTTAKDFENITVVVLFGSNNILSGSIMVEVYNCKEIGKDDCSLCKSKEFLYGEYMCVWCQNDCLYQQCPNNQTELKCPFPSISEIAPLLGVIEGNTRLTVVGTNLGSAVEQVEIKIDTEACLPIKELYVPSKRFVCMTPPSKKGEYSADVVLLVKDIGNKSIATFMYKEVRVGGVSPLVGPQAGGTRVILRGSNLMMSPQTTVTVKTSDNITLRINREESSASQIVILTPPGQAGKVLNITTLAVDGFMYESLNGNFIYYDNPVIHGNDLAMFRSAGCNLTVRGSNLNISSISYLTYKDCFGVYQNVTLIYSNSVQAETSLPRITCSYIQTKWHFDDWSNEFNVTIIDEPTFKIQNQDNSLYMIAMADSNNLSFVNIQDDIFLVSKIYPNVISHVELNNAGNPCKRLRALDNNIICEFEGDPGSEIELTLCKLSFKLALNKQNDFPVWQTALGVSFGVLVVILLIVCATLLIKYFKSKRKYKKLMMDINLMEQEARTQMKEAFAKLQTSEGTMIGGETEIPFNSFRIFAYRILYPKERDDHVLHTKKRMDKYEKKNQCLTQLLNSKFFFNIFVKVLEKQKDIDEKSKIGSYLALFLLDKMDYAAQVITKLLSDRMDSFVSSGKNLKLMMRNGETIVERLMSCWLSLTMYRYLTGTTGRSLFELYLAIKKQVYNGPVDVCTNEAKFTLNEGFFLKKYKFDDDDVLIVSLMNHENKPTNCKLLSCDAISQAKEKIHDKYFHGVPFNLRISADKFDLVWRRSSDDMIRLHDEDGNVDFNDEGHVVRVRTLGSYGVKNGEMFILERRSGEGEESQARILGDETLALFNGSPSLYPITVRMPQRRYHLVNKVELESKSTKGKMFFTEMYYPLLQTKVALEENINKLFREILTFNDSLPPSVKFLFDFIDESVYNKNIGDQDIAKLWKRDGFMLRVWVNLIQNPYFLLDVPKNTVVDVNLAVIGQAFMDCCAPQEKKLNKDSPTSTLLFAKSHKEFRPLVRDFYETIQGYPKMSEQQFMKIMESTYSRDINFNVDFNLEMVLAELYELAKTFKEEILVALDEDESSKNLRLVQKFQFLFNIE